VTNVRDPNPPPPNPRAPEPGGSGGGAGGTGGPSAPVLVTGPSALAFTGSSILVPSIAVALALIAVGGGLLILRQRLRRA
jgi:hypothetical protein